MDEPWETSVTELLGIFRESLIAVVPSMELARIPWKKSSSYDDWDDVSERLYDVIVVRPLAYAREVPKGVTLPKYDYIYSEYKNAFIHVERKSGDKADLGVFVAFSATRPDFLEVEYKKILPTGAVVETETLLVPYEDCLFSIVCPDLGGLKIYGLTISG